MKKFRCFRKRFELDPIGDVMGWFRVVKMVSYSDLQNALEDIQHYLEDMVQFANKLVNTPKATGEGKRFSSAPEQWGPISQSVREYGENLHDYKLNLQRILNIPGIPIINIAKAVRLWLLDFDWRAMNDNIMQLYNMRKPEMHTNPYFRDREGEMNIPVPPDWNRIEMILSSPDLERLG